MTRRLLLLLCIWSLCLIDRSSAQPWEEKSTCKENDCCECPCKVHFSVRYGIILIPIPYFLAFLTLDAIYNNRRNHFFWIVSKNSPLFLIGHAIQSRNKSRKIIIAKSFTRKKSNELLSARTSLSRAKAAIIFIRASIAVVRIRHIHHHPEFTATEC